MPYVRITEEDINPAASFDTIENAVLIFGFDFSGSDNIDDFLDETGKPVDPEMADVPVKYKLYTSLSEFTKDVKPQGDLTVNIATVDSAALRPYITAVDCLTNGLPVIYCSLDHFLHLDNEGESDKGEGIITDGANVVIYKETSEGEITDEIDRNFIFYEFLSAGDYLPKPIVTSETIWNPIGSEGSEGYWETTWSYDKTESSTYVYDEKYHIPANQAERIFEQFRDNDSLAERALAVLLSKHKILFNDRINLPFTFVTTCGYEQKVKEINNLPVTISPVQVLLDETPDRLDFLYLYDFAADAKPEDLLSADITDTSKKPETVAIIHPWGHYTTTFGLRHMPGSYAYLKAYANSIRNNKPWLAVAGINRGVIPGIKAVDWDFSEPYVHAFQGDQTSDIDFIYGSDDPIQVRLNPIVNFGPTFGKIIFGNRTCFLGNGNTALPFRSFLNVRMLLIKIHKAAFASSIQHTFEPNDDIVWLSFKQKVNDVLDQMVSGRGIKWYKWYKLQPDKLGQIKAKLTIRPIEAVESFDITISMTDEDIEVAEE